MPQLLTPNYFLEDYGGIPEPWFYGPVELDSLPPQGVPQTTTINGHKVFILYFDFDPKTGKYHYRWSVFKGWEPVDPTKPPVWPGR